MPFDITKAARPNILKLEPYRCAREYVRFSPCEWLEDRETDRESTATTKMMGQTFFSMRMKMHMALDWR